MKIYTIFLSSFFCFKNIYSRSLYNKAFLYHKCVALCIVSYFSSATTLNLYNCIHLIYLISLCIFWTIDSYMKKMQYNFFWHHNFCSFKNIYSLYLSTIQGLSILCMSLYIASYSSTAATLNLYLFNFIVDLCIIHKYPHPSLISPPYCKAGYYTSWPDFVSFLPWMYISFLLLPINIILSFQDFS